MKITIDINPKEIANLAVEEQGQPISISNSVEDEVEFFVKEGILLDRHGYYWADQNAYKLKLFDWRQSIEKILETVEEIYPNKRIVLKFV